MHIYEQSQTHKFIMSNQSLIDIYLQTYKAFLFVSQKESVKLYRT